MNLNRFYPLLIVFSVLLTSCANTPVIDPETFQHILSVDKDGGISKENIQFKETNFTRENRASKVGQIQEIMSGLKEFDKASDEESHIVIFIHGGLNSEAGALKRVAEKHDFIKYAFPIFVNWNTSFSSTYVNHLVRIRQGEVSETAPLTAPFYFLTDVGNTIINAPKSWLVSGLHSAKSGLIRKRKNIDQALEDQSSKYEFIKFDGNDQSKNNLISRGKWLATSPIKLVTTPFVYTLAKPSWDVMLRRSNTVLYRFNSDNSIDEEHTDEIEELGSLALLMKEIEQYAKSEKKKKIKISLVGHSMGAIVANKLLTYDLNLEIDNIVHMASADTVENVFTKVIPYLKENKNSRFFSMHLHPDNEDRESNYGGLIPSGSLLVWIDEMYTSPDSIMSRRAGRWDNLTKILDRLPLDEEIMSRLFFKIFGLNKYGSDRDKDGFLTAPQKHGDFGHLKFWKEETWW